MIGVSMRQIQQYSRLQSVLVAPEALEQQGVHNHIFCSSLLVGLPLQALSTATMRCGARWGGQTPRHVKQLLP